MKNCSAGTSDKVERIIEAMGHDVDWVEDGVIGIDDGVWMISVVDEGRIHLSFHVNTCPVIVADIAKNISLLATEMGIKVYVEDIFAFEFGPDGKVKDVAFGQEAYELVGREHYFGINN